MAYITHDMIIASREKTWRGVISIAERVLNEARERNLPIVLYIDNGDNENGDPEFRLFHPAQLFELNDTNFRGRPPEKFYHIQARFGRKLESLEGITNLEKFGFTFRSG